MCCAKQYYPLLRPKRFHEIYWRFNSWLKSHFSARAGEFLRLFIFCNLSGFFPEGNYYARCGNQFERKKMCVESWFNPNVNCEVLMIYQSLIQFPYQLNCLSWRCETVISIKTDPTRRIYLMFNIGVKTILSIMGQRSNV